MRISDKEFPTDLKYRWDAWFWHHFGDGLVIFKLCIYHVSWEV